MKVAKLPLISVVVPCLDRAHYLAPTLESILQQDYQNLECIVVDGGSTDNTLTILKKYEHLKWISEADMGQSDAMNKAFNMSDGDIIGYLNADDEYEDDTFNSVVQLFISYPKVEFVAGALNRFKQNFIKSHLPSDSLMEILDLKSLKFPLNPVSYFYYRKVQEQIGDFPLTNHFTMDFWFLLQVYSQNKIIVVNKIFGNYYFLNNKSSDGVKSNQSLIEVRNQFLRDNPMLRVKFYLMWPLRVGKSFCVKIVTKLLLIVRR